MIPDNHRSLLPPGLPVFDAQGQVVGLLNSSAEGTENQLTPLPAVLAALVRWSSVKGPDGAIMRSWSDNTGKFRVSAQLVGVSGDTVTLAREGGERVSVPLERLSDSDRRLIECIEAGKKE